MRLVVVVDDLRACVCAVCVGCVELLLDVLREREPAVSDDDLACPVRVLATAALTNYGRLSPIGKLDQRGVLKH